jgi:hypothetical protein
VGVATRLLREAVRLKFSLGSVDMGMREITEQHKLGLISQSEMYDRLILAQLDKCEATGSADDYWRLDKLVSIAKSRRGDS